MRILIAEDERGVREWLVRAVEALGHRAESVENGSELVRRAGDLLPDAVISDIGMPQCDGIRAGLRLRREHPKIPLILMTGDPAMAGLARRAGFGCVLLKPFPLEELSAALSSF